MGWPGRVAQALHCEKVGEGAVSRASGNYCTVDIYLIYLYRRSVAS